jgi:tetratricopeptide (TPR) repeat protein
LPNPGEPVAVAAGYAAEMRRIDEDIAETEEAASSDPADPERITRHVYRLYQKASISGDLAALTGVEHVIDDAIPLLSNPGDLYLLKAHAAFKLHKLADVHAALLTVPSVFDSEEGPLIRADLDLQHGHYQAAETGYVDVLGRERSWGALARLAHLRGKMGDVAGAERLYEEAEDQLTAKEMRAYAWLEVQRGFLDFTRGQHDAARSHYQRAEAAYPGYWLVEEHVAEVLGAEGKYDEAVAIYQRIVSSSHRPELEQAICELCELAGRSRPVAYWKERALTAYLQSAQRGEVHYYHHLVDYYVDVAEDGGEAVQWAYKDLGLRENFATQAALAWSLYRDRQLSDAVHWIDRALASGVVDALLYFRAGEIYRAAGKELESRNLRERALNLNPAVARFHVHH